MWNGCGIVELGSILIIMGFIASISELFVLLWFEISQKERWQPLSNICSGISLTFTCGAFLVLIIHFLRNNFSVIYVFFQSRQDLSVPIKISAVWSGSEGSLLLWVVLLSIFNFHFKAKMAKSGDNELLWYSYIILTGLNIFFIWLIITNSPFSTHPPQFFCHTTSAYPCHSLLTRFPTVEGFGLSPLLQNKWNLIHPVMVFIGYSGTIVPFSLGLASLVTNKRVDTHLRRYIDRLLSIAWIFLSLGIIVGAYWAYNTLGWGGYWMWDPVETVSLIPWLLCTAYFHFRSILTRNSRSLYLLASSCFISVLGAVYITRGGALISIHSFTPSNITYILGIVFLVTFLLLIGAYLKKPPRIHIQYRKWLFKTSLIRKSKYLAGYSLVLMSIICFIGVFLPPTLFLLTGQIFGILPSYYLFVLSPFFLILLLSLIGCQISNMKMHQMKNARFHMGIILLACCVFVLIFPPINLVSKLGIGFLMFTIIITIYGVTQETIRSKIRRWKIRSFSRGLIHLGIVLISLGVFLNGSTKSGYDESVISYVKLDEAASFDQQGVIIKVEEVQFVYKSSPFDYDIFLTITVTEGSKTYTESIAFIVDPRYITDEGKPMAFAPPIIIHGLQKDIYIMVFAPPTPVSPNPVLVPLAISIVRYVTLIWVGSIVMFSGIFLTIFIQISTNFHTNHERKFLY